MDTLLVFLQIIVALGIYNVWIVRFDKKTSWRGARAKNMREEFAAYGLSSWFLEVIRVLKLSCATLLVVGIWYPTIVLPAAAGLAVLMLGAVSMHIKVKDPLRKSMPAFSMLALSILIVVLSQSQWF